MSEIWIPIASTADCPGGQGNPFEVQGRHIAVFNLEGRFFATSNVCTHQFALMSDGYVEGEYIECPMHQGRFHIPTGCPQGVPVSEPLQTYPLRIQDGRIEINLTDETAP
jgi:nitrite reductase/ring-hydroxylating ferredoxin subunit